MKKKFSPPRRQDAKFFTNKRILLLGALASWRLVLPIPALAQATTDASAPAQAGAAAAQSEHHVAPAGTLATPSANGETVTKQSTPAPAAASNTATAGQTPVGGAATVGQSVTVSTAAPAAAPAPATHAELEHQSWPFDGIFGTYDRAQLQRGFQVYKQVCSACHSLNLLSYRNLEDIGYSEGQVKAIAQDYQVSDGPNDEGEMFQRPAKPSDRFHAPFPNKKAAAAANGGAAPPDMSLLAKAREGGPDYIYGILTGFADPPPGITLQPGQYYNKTMPGHIIAMPPPLHDGAVTYDNAPGIPNTVEQNARDVSAFLQWASEPHQDERKRTGLKAFMFLAIFATVLGMVKKKIWRKEH